jgi:FkbM family methyltransferase
MVRGPASAAGVMRARARVGVHRLRRRQFERRLASRRLIGAFADENPRAHFIEIGANDGAQHDHLRPCILEREWTGVMVEPVPYIFDRLRTNYADVQRVALENAAIADHDGEAPFYYLVDASEEERRRLPDWYDGIGSFSRETLMSHVTDIPDIADRIVCAPVPTFTFDSLCARHRVERVDLLVIDTEGYDWEVLRHVDLRAWRPQLVVYEHFHLSPDDRARSRAHLRAAGYETLEEGFDTLCLDVEANDRLAAVWRTLRPAVAGVSKSEERR